MTALVFVDTNVLVYARDARDAAKHAAARAWVESLWAERTGRTSAQVLSEYYVTLTRKLRPRADPEVAWADVRRLSAWNPQPIDMRVVAEAREFERRYRLGWRDCLVAAAAVRQACGILLSEDFQDGMVIDSIKVLNPFRHEVSEPAALHASRPQARPVHRARGRPRKSVAA